MKRVFNTIVLVICVLQLAAQPDQDGPTKYFFPNGKVSSEHQCSCLQTYSDFGPNSGCYGYLCIMTKTIFIGSDHAGFELKHILKDHLRNKGFEVQDKGTHVKDSVDYPDYAHAVAKSVVAEPDSFGIVICGTH